MAYVAITKRNAGDAILASDQQQMVDNFSALYDRDGLVPVYKTTFSAASSVTASANVLSSTYTNYRVLVVITAASASTSLLLRLRAGASDFTSATHYRAQYVVNATGGAAAAGSTTDPGFVIGQHFNGTSTYGYSVDLYGPNTSNAYKAAIAHSASWDGGGAAAGTYMQIASMRVSTSTQYDSFSLVPSSGTVTGEVQVYGYAKP